jgi:hypothetical protein
MSVRGCYTLTHVHRVGSDLGLVSSGTSLDLRPLCTSQGHTAFGFGIAEVIDAVCLTPQALRLRVSKPSSSRALIEGVGSLLAFLLTT